MLKDPTGNRFIGRERRKFDDSMQELFPMYPRPKDDEHDKIPRAAHEASVKVAAGGGLTNVRSQTYYVPIANIARQTPSLTPVEIVLHAQYVLRQKVSVRRGRTLARVQMIRADAESSVAHVFTS